MKKRGVTLVTVIVTILLILILVGITTAGVGNGIQNARFAAFGQELVTLEDSVRTYYIQNGEYPILENTEYKYENNVLKSDDGATITLNNSKSEYLESFKQELIENSDISDGENIVSDTYFYKLDLNKIDVKSISRGNGTSASDIYVMAYPSQNIYYIKGVIADKKIYFSLANISDTKKIEQKSEITTFQNNGITVTKENKAWTNVLDINIKAELGAAEKLYVKVPVRNDEIMLNSKEGNNEINIKSLDGSLGLTKNEIDRYNELEIKDRYIYVIKRKNGVESGKIKVDISNYETKSPEFKLKDDNKTVDFEIKSEIGYNKVTFQGIDNVSGIGEVRYVFLKQFGANGIPKDLITDTSILTDDYMLRNGKKATVSNLGKVEMNLPKDVEGIHITMFDKAGNSISMDKNVQTDVYVGINPVSISGKLKFGIVARLANQISYAKIYIGDDENSFTNETNLSFTKDSNGIYQANVEFDSTDKENVYIKVVIKDNSNPQIVEERIKKIDLKQVAKNLVSVAEPGIIYEENRYYTDKNGSKAIVPAGFKVSSKQSEQVINDGLVIYDKNDNEYVWIPCTIDGSNGSIKYEKWEGSKSTDYTVKASQTKDDSLPNGIASEKDQVKNYGGFYVARYEASLSDEQTTSTLMVTKTFSVNDNNRSDIGKAQSKAGKIVWNRINYSNAKLVSENVVVTNEVQSGLITGTQWDTMLKFIASAGVNVDTDSTSWGNYNDKKGYSISGYYRTQHADIVYSKGSYTKSQNGYLLLQTGKFAETVSTGSPKNLCDVAGNEWEWSAETVSQKGGNNTVVGNKVVRGGGCGSNGSSSSAYCRDGSVLTNGTAPHVGFRFVLYIK